MKSTIARITIALALLVGALALPASSIASPDAKLVVGITIPLGIQGNCAPGVTKKVRVFENTSGDVGDNDDSLWLCGNDPGLNNNSHTLPGNCDDGGLGGGTWNDCIGSATVVAPSGWRVCFYNLTNYGVFINSLPAGATRDNIGGMADSVSSLKFVFGQESACGN